MSINQVFHQTWKTKELDCKANKNSNIIRKLYSDYEYVLWDDTMIANFLEKNFMEYNNWIVNLSKIHQIDIVRLLWMYKFGGIYADLDIKFNDKIDFSIYNGVVFFEREWTFPKNDYITTSVHNCIFASRAKHEIWIDIVNEIRKKYDNGIRNVFDLTGPNSISEILTRLKLLQKYDNITILPGKYIFQRNFSVSATKEKCYIEHQCYGSWMGNTK